MDTESSCTTVLISDDPSKTDSFGSHERVAKAIAQLINKEDGGKSIALTGTWGSGKSTVVELMKNHLADDTEVFVFDAWAHEGDPLRRTFLEQLIDFLKDCGWIDDKCAEMKEKLSGKINTQKIETTPIVTDTGKKFGLATLLVPLGIAIFSWVPSMLERLSDVNVPVLWGAIFSLIFIGILLTVSPLFVLYRHQSTSGDPPNKTNKDAGALINQHVTIEESETIEGIEPTSLEFQYYFSELLGFALNEGNIEPNKQKKLLIVVDNLDRVDTKDALEIWATMRTFFEFDSNNAAGWKSHLWLLVPFDKDALTRIWHFADEQSSSKQVVQSFIDKSFQIIFNVASPVHTAWKDFLMCQLEDALPEHTNHNPDDFHTVYRLYRLCGITNNKFPTPRDLKLFVNNIGALYRQWHDEIPLPIQALYVILQRKGNHNFENELRDDEIVGDKERQLIDSKYKRYLAALHFNVPIEMSLQILMAPRIEAALRDGDIDDMNKICELEGFAQVCEMVLEENCPDWSRSGGRDICIAADTLSALEQIDDASWRSIWDLLCLSIGQIPFLGEIDDKIGNGLRQLLRHQPNNDFAKSIIMLTGKSASRFDDSIQSIEHDSLDNWLKGIFAVLMELHETDRQNMIDEHFWIYGSASNYIEIISRLNANPVWNIMQPYFKTKAESNEVIIALTGKAHDQKFYDYRKCAETMLQTGQKWQWENFIPTLILQLQGSKNIASAEIYANLYTLLHLEKNGVSLDIAWNDLSNGGHLFHQIHGANDDAKAISLCLIPILQIVPNGNPRQHINNSQAGLNKFNAIMKSPESYTHIVSCFARHVVKFSTFETCLELPVEAPNTSNFICETMEAIAKEESLAKMLTEYDFNVDNSRIYSIALKKIDPNYEQKFAEFLISGFKNIDLNTWFSEMHHDGSTLQLLVDVVDTGHQPELTTNFQDALLEHAKHLIEGNAELHPSKDNWYKVYSALASHTKITFLKKLLDMVIRYEDDSTDKILDIYGELLVDCNILNNDADDLVLVGFKNFIEKMSDVELTWMNNVISNCPTILTACELQSKMDFEDRMILALNNDELSEEIQGLLGTIAKQLGIDILQKDEWSGTHILKV